MARSYVHEKRFNGSVPPTYLDPIIDKRITANFDFNTYIQPIPVLKANWIFLHVVQNSPEARRLAKTGSHLNDIFFSFHYYMVNKLRNVDISSLPTKFRLTLNLDSGTKGYEPKYLFWINLSPTQSIQPFVKQVSNGSKHFVSCTNLEKQGGLSLAGYLSVFTWRFWLAIVTTGVFSGYFVNHIFRGKAAFLNKSFVYCILICESSNVIEKSR